MHCEWCGRQIDEDAFNDPPPFLCLYCRRRWEPAKLDPPKEHIVATVSFTGKRSLQAAASLAALATTVLAIASQLNPTHILALLAAQVFFTTATASVAAYYLVRAFGPRVYQLTLRSEKLPRSVPRPWDYA